MTALFAIAARLAGWNNSENTLLFRNQQGDKGEKGGR
jgi:hypothetical protein